ncbi:hypothetical protein PG985_003895 [Apiospora marii]|uniref:uncharacterized protein n=1 Tax=Apiospora marii TaxID=335849 RepID=UPI00312DB67B
MNSAEDYSRVVITPNSPISASAPSDFYASHHDPSMATLPRDAPPRASPPSAAAAANPGRTSRPGACRRRPPR